MQQGEKEGEDGVQREGVKDEGDERNEGWKRRRIGGDLIAEFPVVMSTVDHPLLFSSFLSLALLSSLSINLAKSQDRILFPSRIGEYFHSKYILYPFSSSSSSSPPSS